MAPEAKVISPRVILAASRGTNFHMSFTRQSASSIIQIYFCYIRDVR